MPAKKPSKPSSQTPELDLVNNLAKILNTTGLSEIELEQKGVRVRVSKGMALAQHHMIAAPLAPAPLAAALPAAAAAATVGADVQGTVKSPMVGTAYLTSAPGAAPFVAIGSEVKLGQTVLIIEAMKTMNQIPAPRAGKVTSIFVENGQPVEFGEPLLAIE